MAKSDQLRVPAWRSKMMQDAAAIGKVARTCRRFGISRKSFYTWRRRFAITAPRVPPRLLYVDDVRARAVALFQAVRRAH
jgi:hypothetical protein